MTNRRGDKQTVQQIRHFTLCDKGQFASLRSAVGQLTWRMHSWTPSPRKALGRGTHSRAPAAIAATKSETMTRIHGMASHLLKKMKASRVP